MQYFIKKKKIAKFKIQNACIDCVRSGNQSTNIKFNEKRLSLNPILIKHNHCPCTIEYTDCIVSINHVRTSIINTNTGLLGVNSHLKDGKWVSNQKINELHKNETIIYFTMYNHLSWGGHIIRNYTMICKHPNMLLRYIFQMCNFNCFR
jgi:hypothetical protein